MRPTPTPFPLRRLLVAITLVAPTASAVAQDDPADGVTEIVVRGSYTTNDLLESATGLGLSIRETPQSVSVMTFERLADQNLRSLADVVQNAAGTSAKEGDSSRDFLSARGFDIDNYQIDGIPMEWTAGGDAGESQSDTALYERVEIVRGATGLLTGAGNPSASINLVRKHADSRELEASASLGVGSWRSRSGMLDVSTPLNAAATIRARTVLNHEQGESHTDYLENRKSVGYLVVEGDVGERTLLRLGASYQDNDPTASTWGGLPAWHSDGTRTDWPRSKTIGADWTRWASTNENEFLNLIHSFANGWEATLNLNYAHNDAELELLYLYGEPDRVTGLGLGPSPYFSDTSRKQRGAGLHIAGAYELLGREHELAFGFSTRQMNDVIDTYALEGIAEVGNFNEWDGSYPQPIRGERRTDSDLDIEQSGAYLATRLTLTDDFRVVLGVRNADWSQRGESYGSTVDYGDSGVVIPYAGALYDLTSVHTAYVSYTEIFKPQNAQDRYGSYLDPVVGKGYEAGLKSTFLDGGLYTTATLFRIDQDNVAQPDPGHVIPGTIFEASRAARGTRSEGYEIEVVGQPQPNWDVSLSYTRFTAEDEAGVDVNTNHPREMLKLFSTWQFSGTWSKLTLGGGLNWEGENYTVAWNPVTGLDERLEQESYALVSLMASYAFSPQLSAQLNVENLLDEEYYSQIGFYNQLAFGAPRNVQLRLNYEF